MSYETSGSSSSSIKAAQLNAIYRMLDFNGDEAFTGGGTNSGGGMFDSYGSSNINNNNNSNRNTNSNTINHQWKILIYDTTCRSIISPILSVQQLRRKCNVTLHLLLHSDREPIPDVPAIYFVAPTKENLVRIVQDCTKQLYANIHVNFVTKLERTLMEEFAQLLIQSSIQNQNNIQQIASIHDQYLNYICYEDSLFTLNGMNGTSYVQYNQSQLSEQAIDTYMTHIAYGLFSIVASYSNGQIPIIRCPKGGAPEMVARKLNRMIVEHPTLLQHSSSSSHQQQTGGVGSGGRPLLVILDRNSDLITPIQHCSTYQALIDDLLIHKANRVEFEVSADSTNANDKRNVNKKVVKKYDLDPDLDPFYSVHKFAPFPEAIEQNDSELKDVTQREQLIRSKTSATGTTTNTPDPFATAGATDLATAVDSLPLLIERKKQLEVHTSILQGVMNEVAARDVPQFYDIESSLATGTYKNDFPKAKKDVLALVSDPSKGNVYDKLRLVLVFALSTNAKSTDLDEVTTAFQQVMELKSVDDKTIGPAVSAGMKAIAYIKQLRLMKMIPSANDSMMQELQSNKSKTNTSVLSSFMATATTQATGLLAKATDRVSSMLGKIHKHHVTVVTENLCEHTHRPNNVEDETYLYLDPKVKGDVTIQQLQSISLHRPPIYNAIVFMIGGGCYNEYQNIQSLLRTDKRTICYGSTELLDPNSFVQQLGQLG